MASRDNNGNDFKTRTVYITPIKPDMIDDIKCFFEKFGRLNSVEMRQTKKDDLVVPGWSTTTKNLIHYGLVEFESAESAVAVLLNESLRIGDCDFQVRTPKTLRNSDDDYREFLSNLCRSMDGLRVPEIGSANDFTQLNNEDTTVYLTNYNIPIRTLYIAPIMPNMNDQIKSYFEQFGEVKSLEIYQENCGLIEFKKVESASAVLFSETHHIDGCAVQVKFAESCYQPDHILKALDDDCLREILSYLNALDLSKAAAVCTRFNGLAKSKFSTHKYRKMDLTKCGYGEAKTALKHFGPLCQSIDIGGYNLFPKSSGTVDGENVLSLIDECCTTTLEELKLNGFHFKKERQFRRNARFPIHDDTVWMQFQASLKKIYLNRCYLSKSTGNLLFDCNELKVLHLEKCSVDGGTYVQKFDNLDELRLTEIRGFDGGLLNRFIELNPTLTKLAVCRIEFPIHPSNIIATVVKNLRNLEEFELDMLVLQPAQIEKFVKCVIILSTVTSLKVLKLNLNNLPCGLPSRAFVMKDTPIEYMQLSHGKISTKCVTYITQMKRLKVFELNEIAGLIDDHMIELAKGLGHQLEKLRFTGSTAVNVTMDGLKNMLPYATKLNLLSLGSTKIKIDAESYEVMLNILQNRPEKVKFLLKLRDSGGKVEVSEKVLMENDDVFSIEYD